MAPEVHLDPLPIVSDQPKVENQVQDQPKVQNQSECVTNDL